MILKGPGKRENIPISSHVNAQRIAKHLASKAKGRVRMKKRFQKIRGTHKFLKDEARKTIEANREKHVENQFNSDRTINVLRTALETFFTDNWEQLVVPVYATDTSANNETKEQPVGYSVKSDRVREVNAVVAEYDNDTDGRAIHSRGMFGETVLHQVVLAFVAPELAHGL